jgi:putative exosortase-associated protein (TIGR04073 family)
MKGWNMRTWSRWAMVILILVVFSGCSSTNWVGREDESAVYQAPRKLARGTANIVSGPLELVNQPVRLAKKEESFQRQVTGALAGVFVGVGYGVGRIVAGAFDIVTAPILVPQRAIIEPEFMSPDFMEWAFGEESSEVTLTSSR